MESLNIGFEKLASDPEIDSFVAVNPNATIFHTSEWMRIIEKQNYKPLTFVARDGAGLIRAVIPFFLAPVSNLPVYVAHSIPQSESGGPLLGEGIVACELAAPLIKTMRSLALSKRIIQYTIVTPDAGLCTELLPRSKVESPASYLKLDLKQVTPEQIWNQVFTRDGRQRNNIRRMESDGVTARIATESDLPQFYSLYQHTLKRAGASPYPYSFLKDIWTYMHPKYFNILLTIHNERIIGGSAFLHLPERRRLWMLLGGYETQPGTRNTVNLFMWWHTLLWASHNGYDEVDLGTDNPDSSNPIFKFKKQFAPKISKKYFVRQPMIPESALRLLRGVRGLMD